MKKIFNILIVVTGVVTFYSCEIDNYEGPDASLQGMIYDEHGEPLQLEHGQGAGRIRMEEISWSDNPVPQYLNVRIDGSYSNSKLFAGTYVATPVEGAFYPVTGDTIVLGGNTTHDFEVIPYLDIEWVSDPTVLPDGRVIASFRFVRNAGPAALPNLLDYQLFISTTKYVGNNNFDGTLVGPVVPVSNEQEGQELTIATVAPMKYETTYYVRIGVRVNDSYKKYNYTTIKTINVTDLP